MLFCFLVMFTGCITLLARVRRRTVASASLGAGKLRVNDILMPGPRQPSIKFQPEIWASGGVGGSRTDIANAVLR